HGRQWDALWHAAARAGLVCLPVDQQHSVALDTLSTRKPMPLIDVIGLGADGQAGLRPELAERIRRADFLAGGERHLRFFPSASAARFVIRSNLTELLSELQTRALDQRCVVLGSGDPLFYGIGTYLAEHLGPARVRIEPAVSSMQLAFARAGIS